MLRCECLTWVEPAIQSTTSPWSAVNFNKTSDLDKVQHEPTIWSHETGQRIPCFDRCQLTITLMSNIKDVCCKLARVLTKVLPPGMSSKLEFVIWLRDTGHIGKHGRVDGRADVRTYVRTDDR